MYVGPGRIQAILLIDNLLKWTLNWPGLENNCPSPNTLPGSAFCLLLQSGEFEGLVLAANRVRVPDRQPSSRVPDTQPPSESGWKDGLHFFPPTVFRSVMVSLVTQKI